MAKLRAGILGQVSGKVSGVVGGTWKDKNYVREYVIPANPNSAAQQTQRGKFALCVAFAKPIVGAVFNVYTDPFQPKMSGFNFFVKRNIALFTATPTYSSVKTTEGKLFTPVIADAVGSAAASEITITWSTDLGSNGSATDAIYGVVYNETTGRWYFFSAEDTRNNGVSGHVISQALTVSDVLHCYIWAAKYTGTALTEISDSDYFVETVTS